MAININYRNASQMLNILLRLFNTKMNTYRGRNWGNSKQGKMKTAAAKGRGLLILLSRNEPDFVFGN